MSRNLLRNGLDTGIQDEASYCEGTFAVTMAVVQPPTAVSARGLLSGRSYLVFREGCAAGSGASSAFEPEVSGLVLMSGEATILVSTQMLDPHGPVPRVVTPPPISIISPTLAMVCPPPFRISTTASTMLGVNPGGQMMVGPSFPSLRQSPSSDSVRRPRAARKVLPLGFFVFSLGKTRVDPSNWTTVGSSGVTMVTSSPTSRCPP